jgi:Fe-S cluster assembly protein SufB/Fe-S cluster assembly protein SufD
MAQRILGSFTEEAARSLSESLREPDWLTELRLRSFQSFASLPAETNPLYTKYAFISEFDATQFRLDARKLGPDLRSYFRDYLTGKERNIILQANQTEVHADLDAETASAGVVLLPIHEAIRLHERKLREAFEQRLVKSESDRYAAFVNAFFNSGTFVFVPKRVVLDQPLRRVLLTDNPESGIVDQTFIFAEEGSRVVFLEELYSRPGGAKPLIASTAEVRAAPSSSVDFSSIQLLNEQAVHLSNRAVDLASDSKASVSTLSLGALVSRSRMNFLLSGRGASAEGFEIFFTDAKQRYDFESNLVHIAQDTTGSTQARGVLKGESQSIFKGMIKIGSGAKNSRAYLAHHAMLLEKTAKSDGIPGLEILTNEVKATHSASVAQLDEEQLFYLMARGLPLDEARKMMVLGFFEPVLSRVPIEQTREGARFMIEGKWHGEKRTLADREAIIAQTGETMPEVRPPEDIFERHYKYRQ